MRVSRIHAFNTGDVVTIYLTLIVTFGTIYAMCYDPEAALFSDLFDAKVRYTGIPFVYQFSGIFASSITPLIATYLFKIGDKKPWFICAYVVFAALVSMACAIATGRRRIPDARNRKGSLRRLPFPDFLACLPDYIWT